eukprot:765106-Hanusia_phi.AAC.1
MLPASCLPSKFDRSKRILFGSGTLAKMSTLLIMSHRGQPRCVARSDIDVDIERAHGMRDHDVDHLQRTDKELIEVRGAAMLLGLCIGNRTQERYGHAKRHVVAAGVDFRRFAHDGTEGGMQRDGNEAAEANRAAARRTSHRAAYRATR